MAYFFPAPVDEQLAYLRRSVEGLRAGGIWGGAYLHDTTLALLAVESAMARDLLPFEAVRRHRRDVSEALAPFGEQLAGYVEIVADEAIAADDDAWPELCGKRSAIELLLTRYAGSPAVAAVDPSVVARLDDHLRALGLEHGPVGPAFRIPAMPAAHAWWWMPSEPPRPLAPIDEARSMIEQRLSERAERGHRLASLETLRARLLTVRRIVAGEGSPRHDDAELEPASVLAPDEVALAAPELAALLARIAGELARR